MTVRLAATQGMGVAAGYALGVAFGAVIWAAAALMGLSVLFQVLPSLLIAMKIIGALFLVYIGYKTFRHAKDALPVATLDTGRMSTMAAIRLGLILQLTNPKPAVFFGAVFVAMVPPGISWVGLAIILALVWINEIGSNLFVARIFSLSRTRSVYMRIKTSIERAFGALMAGFGLHLALS